MLHFTGTTMVLFDQDFNAQSCRVSGGSLMAYDELGVWTEDVPQSLTQLGATRANAMLHDNERRTRAQQKTGDVVSTSPVQKIRSVNNFS